MKRKEVLMCRCKSPIPIEAMSPGIFLCARCRKRTKLVPESVIRNRKKAKANLEEWERIVDWILMKQVFGW